MGYLHRVQLRETVADALDTAAQVVEQGWCQGRFGGLKAPDGKCCATQAIREAVSSEQEVALVSPYVFDAFRRHLGYRDITSWNDANKRRREDVVEALHAAAARVRAGDLLLDYGLNHPLYYFR